MSFLSPLFLAGAGLAAIPILLHLLEREPEPRVKFSAVRFLRHAPIELARHRRLRELVLLALRVAALVLLSLAFARPFFGSAAGAGSGGVTMVAVDTSYSLSAPGRVERARQLAKDAVRRAPPNDSVGVLAFSDVADVVAKPSGDRELALSAIDRVTAGYGATRYRVGLDAAVQAIDGRRGTIVVVTDLQECGWDSGDRVSVPESTRIEIADVGPVPPNLAVTAIASSPGRISAWIRNTGAAARDTRVRATLDGRNAGETQASIGPNAASEVAFAVPPSRNASAGAAAARVAEIAIDDPDGLQADNVRYAVLDSSGRTSVLVVTATGDLEREAFYVERALAAEAATGGAYEIAGTGAGGLAEALQRGEADPPGAVFLLSTRGLERRGREALAQYIRAGGGLFMAAGPQVDGEVIRDVLGEGTPLTLERGDHPGNPRPVIEVQPGSAPSATAMTLVPTDGRHPIFQPFGRTAATLGLVKFRRVARIGGPGCQTLARFTNDEPALVDCAAGGGRALVMASDLDNQGNDFPLHASFVAFVHEAVRYLGSGRSHAREYLIGDAPGAPRRPGIASVGDVGDREGGSRVRRRIRRVAINVDPAEGDPARMSADEFQSAVTRLKILSRPKARLDARRQEDRQQLWRYVLSLIAVVLACESLVARRA